MVTSDFLVVKGFEKGAVDQGLREDSRVFGGGQKLQEESLLLYGEDDLQAIHNGGRT